MENSTVPPGSTGAPPGPNNMNLSTTAPPATEPDVSLTSNLNSSIAPPSSTEAPTVLAKAHPPYAEMIITAIRALDDKKGSSKKAIKKYIDATYSNLPNSHAALLSHHLKRLKSGGVVIMVKHSYKLPKNVKAAFQLSSQSKSAASAATPDAAPSSLTVLGKRGRGRPPKPKPISVTGGPDGQVLQQKRGRGRPPKPKPMLIPGSNGFLAPPKPRRQPKKPRPITITPSYGLVAPKQTRKPAKSRVLGAAAQKGSETGSPRPRGRPRKNAAPPSSAEAGSPGFVNKGGRPRGRPPKVLGNVADGAPVVVLPLDSVGDAGGGGGGGGAAKTGGGVRGDPINLTVPGKRGRGRPRKANGPSTPKRPVGRPKKIRVEEYMLPSVRKGGLTDHGLPTKIDLI